MRIARVFCKKTNWTPDDQDAYFDVPDMFTPSYDKVMVSVVFTWDIERGKWLADQWKAVCNNVTIGGPAFNDAGGEFEPGMFLKNGITITSRGCPNSCAFCFVPKREGKIRELQIRPGNIVQDNNLLACSGKHIDGVFDMLKTQKHVQFKGGIESRLVDTGFVERCKRLSLSEIWIACDYPGAINSAKKAISILRSAGISKGKIRCFVLIGKDMNEEQDRLLELYHSGCLPFAQLYQPEQKIEYSKEWKQFCRIWSRPALYRSAAKFSWRPNFM